jgi:hypothetical protein
MSFLDQTPLQSGFREKHSEVLENIDLVGRRHRNGRLQRIRDLCALASKAQKSSFHQFEAKAKEAPADLSGEITTVPWIWQIWHPSNSQPRKKRCLN